MVHVQDSNDPTGVSADKPGAEVVRARDRKANAALQLKLAGASWADIAEVVGYPTERAAKVAMELALEKELHEETSQKQLRQLAGKRLERLLRSVWSKANDESHPEHLQANGRAREILAQYNKLFGLDAPAEFVVHSPTAGALEEWVSRATAAVVPQLEEGDIFDEDVWDGEVIEEVKEA